MAERPFRIEADRGTGPQVLARGHADDSDQLTFTEVAPGLGRLPAETIALEDFQAHLDDATRSSGWTHSVVWE